MTPTHTVTSTVTPTNTVTPTVTPTKTLPPTLGITLTGIGLAAGDAYYVPNNNIYAYGVKFKGATDTIKSPSADRLFFNSINVSTDYAFIIIKNAANITIGVIATTKNITNSYFAWSSAGMSRKYYYKMPASPAYSTEVVFPRDNLWP